MVVFTYMSTGLALQRRRLAGKPPRRLAVAGAALAAAAGGARGDAFNQWLAAAAEFIAMATAECADSGPIDVELGAAAGGSGTFVLEEIGIALENWYAAQFRRIVWCANAVALSVGPEITNYELRGGPTVRGRMLRCAHELAAAADRAAAGYVARAAGERAALLAAVAEQAAAAYEYAAELARLRSCFCDVARAEPGGTADCAVAVGPILQLHLRGAIRFLADELSASISTDDLAAAFAASSAAASAASSAASSAARGKRARSKK